MVSVEAKAIGAKNLHKKYPDIHAVKGIDLDICKGEIFGLIGPDGAGKSTIFSILAGIMEPTEGEISVFGQYPRDIRSKIGYLTQQFSFYTDLSVDENIEYAAGIRKVPKDLLQQRKAKYLKLVGMDKFGSRLAGQLSGGMKQKLALCCILVFQPEILLLDEPTTGVDPVSRREFWDILATLAAEEVTIVVATPYLDEAERCNRVALVYNGQVQQIGTPDSLKIGLGLTRFEVRTDDIEKSEEILSTAISKSDSVIADVQTFGDRLDVLVRNEELGQNQISSSILNNQIGLNEIAKADVTLENVFVSLLKQKGESAKFTPFPYSNSKTLKEGHPPNRKNEIAIGAYNLTKAFGDFYAAKDVCLEVHYGEIFCLLGANGAGKTTTVKMLCGLLNQTSGEICLAGATKDLRSSKIRQKIGYMSQKFTLYNDLTILENLKFYCGVYGVPKNQQSAKIEWALATSGLEGQGNLITGALPGGWKQRISFSASVLHEPEILFLDEPTSGVDPLARRMFWEMISDLARHGTAVLVITHYLEEAEHCNKMAFMTAGQVVAQGSPHEIKGSQPGNLVELNVKDAQKAYLIIKEVVEPWRIALFGRKIHLVLDNPSLDIPKICSLLNQNQIQVISCSPIHFSLEDSFIGIIERANAGG